MIDAYEIGITLVLQDGVSEGLAAVRRDLGVLDQAIAATAQGLARLQVVAGQAVASSEGELRRIAAAVARPGEVARAQDASAEPATSPAAAATRVIEREAAASSRAPQTAATQAAERVVTPPIVNPEPRQPTVALAVMPVATAPALAAPALAPPATRAVAEMPATAAGVRTTAVAPGVVPASPAVPASVPALSVMQPVMIPVATPRLPRTVAPGLPVARTDERAAAVSAAPDLAAFARMMVPVRMTEGATSREAVRDPARHKGEVARDRAAALPAHVAVHAMSSPRAAAPRAATLPSVTVAPAQGTTTSTREGVEQVLQQGAAGPTHGDVYLDGQLMGRWMADRMTRDADRPPSGPTGFDTRRSPAWPGATVGP